MFSAEGIGFRFLGLKLLGRRAPYRKTEQASIAANKSRGPKPTNKLLSSDQLCLLDLLVMVMQVAGC